MGSDRHFEYQNSLPSLLAAERAKVADLERRLEAMRLEVKQIAGEMASSDYLSPSGYWHRALQELLGSAPTQPKDDSEYHPAIARGDE